MAISEIVRSDVILDLDDPPTGHRLTELLQALTGCSVESAELAISDPTPAGPASPDDALSAMARAMVAAQVEVGTGCSSAAAVAAASLVPGLRGRGRLLITDLLDDAALHGDVLGLPAGLDLVERLAEHVVAPQRGRTRSSGSRRRARRAAARRTRRGCRRPAARASRPPGAASRRAA